MNHVTIPGSLTSSIVDIDETSNVGIPGVWIFRFEEGKWMQVRIHMVVYSVGNCHYCHAYICTYSCTCSLSI